LEPTLAASISNTIVKYSLQPYKSDHSAPPIPAELTTGFRLLGSPVGSPTFAREFFNDNVQTSITLLSAAITDPQTKLRLFLQCLIQKLPHLLGCDVLYHFDPNDTPPDWTDWLGGTLRLSFRFFWVPESRAGFLFRLNSGGIRLQHPRCSAFSMGRNPTYVADRKAFRRSNLPGIRHTYMLPWVDFHIKIVLTTHARTSP